MSLNASVPAALALGEGQPYDAFGASIFLKTSGAQTNDQWFVMEGNSPPRMTGPAPHWHRVATEIFVVLEGEITFHTGDQTRRLGPGGYAFIPPGTVHTFANDTDAAVKYLAIASPATPEGYFHELMARVQAGQWPPQDPGEVIELMAAYDSFLPEAM